MEKLFQKLIKFFRENKIVIIVNTATDKGKLCLNPSFKCVDDVVEVTFDSLNDDLFDIARFKTLQGYEDKTLYLENDQDNILMLQAINLENYRHYIKPSYTNAQEFTSQAELESAIQKQISK